MNFYFAYGSNLDEERLRARVPSARPHAVACLPGYVLRLDKRGSDGSAKANIHPAADSEVWGVVYALEAEHWPGLDACEAQYWRFGVDLVCPGSAGRQQAGLSADTYRSAHLAERPVAAAWYKALIVEGARAHRLPPAWLAWLETLDAR